VSGGNTLASGTDALQFVQRAEHPDYERVCEELDWLRPTLTVPLWIIGLK
jgi:hypothetical protein